MANRTVYVELKAKVDGYTSSINKAAKSTDAFSKAAKDAQRSSDTWNKVGLAGVALGAGVAVMAKKSIDAASNLSETVAKAGTVFGVAAGQITAFGDTAAQTLGMSKQQAIDAATTFAVFGKAAGLSGTELAGFSTQLTTLAADMASFSNTTPEQAIEAIGAALRGESEPIRAYGVMLDDAALKAEALAQGIYNGVGPLTQQQKVLAAQASILKQTSDAQGDVARTADGLANTQRRLNAEWADAQAGIGEALLPAATSAAEALGSMLDVFNSLPGPVKTGTLLVAGVGAAAMIATPRVIAFNAAIASTTGSSIAGLAKTGWTKAAFSIAALGTAGGAAAAGIAGLGVVLYGIKQTLDGVQERTATYTEALKANSREQMLNAIAGQDATAAALKMGISQDTLLDAYMGNAGALDLVNQKIDAYLAANGGNMAQNAQAAQVAGALQRELVYVARAHEQVGAAAEAEAAAMTPAQRAAEDLAEAQRKAERAAKSLQAAYEALDAALSKQASKDAAIQAMKDLEKRLNTASESFKGASREALNNRAALRAAADTAGDYAASLKDPQKQVDYLNDFLATARQRLKDAGASGPAINQVLGPLENARDRAQSAADAAGNAADALARIPGTYTAVVQIQQRMQKFFAGGGYVSGPGSDTSDSVPAMLSDGEYVIQARSVRRLGVGFLDAINSGAIRGFAPGGEVTAEQRARRQAKKAARAERADARFEARMAANYATDPVGEAQARLAREKAALARIKKKDSAAYIAQQARVIAARSTRNSARSSASAEAAAAAKAESDRIAAENLAAKGSYDRAAFESSLRGMSAVEAASKRLEKSQGELAGLAEGSAEWYAKQEEILGNQNALADAQAQAQAEANAKQQAAIDAQKSKVEQLAQAWKQQTDAVQSALTSQASLLDSFDFGKAKDAATELTAAEEELLAARREVNTAGTEERAAALERLAAAEKRITDARSASAQAAPTFDNIMGGFRSKMQALSSFRSNIETLAKRGVHPSILQQLISSGVAGGAEMAAALVRFTPDQLGAINATQSQIETDANAIGQISADTMYGSAIAAAGSQLIQLTGSQPIQLNIDGQGVLDALIRLQRQQGGYAWGLA